MIRLEMLLCQRLRSMEYYTSQEVDIEAGLAMSSARARCSTGSDTARITLGVFTTFGDMYPYFPSSVLNL